MAEKKTVYHYTTKKNADAIHKSCEIQPSQSGAYGGNKVYVTTVAPSAGKAAIARNNYDGAWRGREKGGSVDAHIKMDLPANQLQKAPDPSGRDIYTYNGPLKVPGCKK